MVKLRKLLLLLLIGIFHDPVQAIAQDAWYDGSRKIHLWQHGYSTKHESPLFSESPNPNTRKQVLTGRIIVVFEAQKTHKELDTFMMKYQLYRVKKMRIGTSTYLFEVSGENKKSLEIANRIHAEREVTSSYPDWLYLQKEK